MAEFVCRSVAAEYRELCGSSAPGLFVDPMTGLKEEINECVMMPGMCKHGTCVNTPGSFHCECNRGYRYDEASHTCIGKSSIHYALRSDHMTTRQLRDVASQC